jgi:glyoxylase-like metal-dependent hydrolase (beta-lactamase superfamily II)
MQRSSSAFVSVLAIVAASALAACSKPAEQPAPPPAAPTPAPVAEAPPAPKELTHKSFMIGELTGIALRDGVLEFPNDNKIFGLGKTPDEVSALLSAAGQPTDKIQLGLDPLLVQTPDHVLLFDTGAATNFGPTAGQLLTSLADAGVDPKSVTDIFISHVHGDHVGGLVDAQGALNFPNATIHIAKPEWTFLTGLKADKAKEIGVQNHDALVAAMKPKVDAFAPNAELLKGVVKAVAIKGHTPGHSGYRISSGGESLFYIGDAMHSYIISVQRPQWPMAFDYDQKAGAASRVALLAEAEKNGQRIYAVHFPFPGLGKFEKRGDGYVWAAE